MSIKGSPHARFRRALTTGNPTLVLAAAAELPRIDLGDALAICLVLLDGGSPRYGRAAVRWHARLALATPDLDLPEAALALAALQALPGAEGDAAAQALIGLLEGRGQAASARVLGAWRGRRA